VNSRLNTGEGEVRLITDQDGFRVGERGRSSGRPVLLLGDSFMEALQVEHEQSFAGRIEATLTSTLGEPVAVRNAGVSGWSPGQYLARARTLLPREPYALVIVAVYVGNDVLSERLDYLPPRQPVASHQLRLPRRISKREILDAVLYPLNETLEVRSQLFVLIKGRLEVLRMKLGISPRYFPDAFLKSVSHDERWGVTAEVCADLAELARSHGAATLFVLIPTDYQVEPEQFNRYVRGFGIDTAAVALDQPSERMKEELTTRGLLVVDALPQLRQLNVAGQTLYGVVDEHLNADGHRALTDLVTPFAAELLANSCHTCPNTGTGPPP
jgi:hypothetical protein